MVRREFANHRLETADIIHIVENLEVSEVYVILVSVKKFIKSWFIDYHCGGRRVKLIVRDE